MIRLCGWMLKCGYKNAVQSDIENIMGFIVAIIGGLILLWLVLIFISLWIFMFSLFAAFMLGGFAAVAIVSGGSDGQAVFFLGGLVSVVILGGIYCYFGSKDKPVSKIG